MGNDIESVQIDSLKVINDIIMCNQILKNQKGKFYSKKASNNYIM